MCTKGPKLRGNLKGFFRNAFHQFMCLSPLREHVWNTCSKHLQLLLPGDSSSYCQAQLTWPGILASAHSSSGARAMGHKSQEGLQQVDLGSYSIYSIIPYIIWGKSLHLWTLVSSSLKWKSSSVHRELSWIKWDHGQYALGTHPSADVIANIYQFLSLLLCIHCLFTAQLWMAKWSQASFPSLICISFNISKMIVKVALFIQPSIWLGSKQSELA